MATGPQLLEIRPKVHPEILVPLDSPSVLHNLIDQFRQGRLIEKPPVVLTDKLAGIHFDMEEFREPEGLPGIVQQIVRINLCLRPTDGQPDVFFGSATQRYLVGE